MEKPVFITDRTGSRWRIASRYAPMMEPVLKRDVDFLINQAESIFRVKKTPVRETLCFECRGMPARIYVKRSLSCGIKDFIKYLFVRSNAVKEWDACRRLEEAGVSATRAVAAGERRRMGVLRESIFISLEVPDSVPLESFFRGKHKELWDTMSMSAKAELARALGRVTAAAHQAGLVHMDFHPGNILVNARSPYASDPVIADLHRVKFRKELSFCERGRNLAQLNMFFSYSSPARLRLRFITEYFKASNGDRNYLGEFADYVEEQTEDLCRSFFAGRERRIGGRNTFFDRFTTEDGFRVWSNQKYSSRAVARLVKRMDSLFAAQEVFKLKDSRSTTLISVESVPEEGLPPKLCIKRINRRSRFFAIKYMFRRCKGYTAWRKANRLLIRNFPTPAPIAAVRKRGISYYISVREEIDNLAVFCMRVHLTDKDRERFAASLDSFIRRMYAKGIWHADMKASNILVRSGGMRKKFEFMLIDTGDLHFGRKVSAGRRFKNRLQLTRTLGDFIDIDSMRCWGMKGGK